MKGFAEFGEEFFIGEYDEYLAFVDENEEYLAQSDYTSLSSNSKTLISWFRVKRVSFRTK